MPPRRPLRVLASLRSANLNDLEEELKALETAGIDGLHVDVMDGQFVEESCFEPGFLQRLRPATELLVDVHLLARDPAPMAPVYAELGADRVSFHLEAIPKPGRLLERLRAEGVEVGLVILPSTPVEELFPWIDELDVVNPLGVNPVEKTGFDEATYARVARLREEIDRRGSACRLQADGGVWSATRDGLVEAGADELVGGYPIFSSDDYAKAVAELRG